MITVKKFALLVAALSQPELARAERRECEATITQIRSKKDQESLSPMDSAALIILTEAGKDGHWKLDADKRAQLPRLYRETLERALQDAEEKALAVDDDLAELREKANDKEATVRERKAARAQLEQRQTATQGAKRLVAELKGALKAHEKAEERRERNAAANADRPKPARRHLDPGGRRGPPAGTLKTDEGDEA
jgi:hypothetical protein